MNWIKRNWQWLFFTFVLMPPLSWYAGYGLSDAILSAHAQKSQDEQTVRRDSPSVLKWTNKAYFGEPLFVFREKTGWEIGPGLAMYIEQHCVAVYVGTHEFPAPDQTLKLRCTAEGK